MISKELWVPVKIIELNKVFVSVSEAARSINSDPKHLSAVLNGRGNSVKGYHVRRVD